MNATEGQAIWYNHWALQNDVLRAVESAASDPLCAPASGSTEWHEIMHAIAHSAVTRHFAEWYGFPESLNGLTPQHIALSFDEMTAVEGRLGLVPGDSDAHPSEELSTGTPLGDSTSILLPDPSASGPAVPFPLSRLAALNISGTPPSEASEAVLDDREPPSEADAPTGSNSPGSHPQAADLTLASGSYPQSPASGDSDQSGLRYHPSAYEIEAALRVEVDHAWELPKWNPSDSPSSGEEAWGQ